MSLTPRLLNFCIGICRPLPGLIRLAVMGLAMAAAILGQHESDPPFASCENPVQRMEVTVVAQAGDESDPRPRWVIKALPGPAQIIVCDRLKNGILRALAQTSPGTGNFDVAGGFRFDLYLKSNVSLSGVEDEALDIEFPVGLLNTPPRPADVGKEFKVVLCVKPAAGACEAASAARAGIEIATASGRAMTHPGIPMLTVGPSVPVTLFYSDEDLAAARKDPRITDTDGAHERVRAELLKVAETVYAEAVKAGSLDSGGQPIFDGPNDQRAQKAFTDHRTAMNALYTLKGDVYDIDWAEVKPNLSCAAGCLPGSAETPLWLWSVDGLSLAEGVNIEVTEEAWETREVQGETIASKLRKRRQAAYDRLNGTDRPDFAFKPGRIPRRDVIGSLTQQKTRGSGDLHLLETRVEAIEKVKSGPILTPNSPPPASGAPAGRNVIYAVRRKKKPELTLSFKTGGSYSKEEGGTGQIGVEETNLFLLKETIAFKAEGGAEVQKYSFSLTRPFKRSEDPRLEFRDVSIDAHVFKDKDKRLGNLTEDEIEARETGSSAGLSFGYDSVGARDRLDENCITNAGRKRTRYGFVADVGLNYRDINIRDDDKLLAITGVSRQLLPRERTQATTLSLGVNALLRHDFRAPQAAGLGVLVLGFDAASHKGVSLFGADYEYWKSRMVFSFDLTFGPSSFRDMFVAYRHGHERGSEGTPIFELPLLGGASSVRGLEEGELIGRRVSFDQFDLGFNVASIYYAVAGKGRLTDPSLCPESAPAAPFDFKNLYVKGFFDHGRLSDSPVAAGGAALRRANGYGLALELRDVLADASGRRVNLAIGYGRSPHSRLHRSGMIVTGVTFEF